MENWVKLRHECSPFKVFLELRNGTEEDVSVRNQISANSQNVVYEVDSAQDEMSFQVIGTIQAAIPGLPLGRSVKFQRTENGITVQRAGKPNIDAVLTLTNDNECKLQVGSDILTLWQFRKRALEDLFFNFEMHNPEVLSQV